MHSATLFTCGSWSSEETPNSLHRAPLPSQSWGLQACTQYGDNFQLSNCKAQICRQPRP